MRRGKEQFKYNASLTIEISLLLPEIFAVIFLLMYLCFYYHDRCVIERYVYSKARVVVDTKNSIYRDSTCNSLEDIRAKLLGVWELNEIESETSDELTIRVIGKMSFSNGLFTGFVSEKVFNIDISESVTMKRGKDYIIGKKKQSIVDVNRQ